MTTSLPSATPRVLFLASDLGASGPAKLVSLLAPALLPRGFEVAVADLTGEGQPAALRRLQAAGVPCWSTPVRSTADLRGLRRLAEVARAFRPDILHVCGDKAARVASLLTLPRVGLATKVVASGVDESLYGLAGWWRGRWLRRVDRFVAPTRAEADRYAGLGVDARRVTLIPPAVAPHHAAIDGAAFRASLDIPPAAKLIVAVGRFDAVAGLRSAVWAFDVVKYVSPEVYLVLVGDGPERERLDRFGKALGFDDHRIRFAGLRADVPGILGLAEQVWVTHGRGGVHVALEAMAAGKAVVAVRNPDLADVVLDGVTGRVTEPGDRVQLAAAANGLLEDPERAAALGAAGRARAGEAFAADRMAERFAAFYHELCGATP